MSTLTLHRKIPRAFQPLLGKHRYKGAEGGRGSGKSHFFGEEMVEQCSIRKGVRAVCIREVQKTLKESAKHLIEEKIDALGAVGFTVLNDEIKTPGGGVIIFQGMQDHTAESIKSLENFDIAWVEEGQTLSATSLRLLRPTIRAEDSELWFSWNPRHKNDPVDVMFKQKQPPTGAVCIQANWSENPWFPDVLEQERQDCLRDNPDQYEHIWEGGYVTVAEGAYYATQLAKARKEGRITDNIAPDELLPHKLFIDIGGTGAKSDHFVIWAAQFVGTEIWWLNHYEAQGQPIGAHLHWMRENGYTPNEASIYLPHDGETHDRVYDVSYESAFKKAGYDVEVVPNQGRGAAMQRVEEARRLFPHMRFHETKCKAGLEALGWYHEKKDEIRNVGLGPEHDWSSHSADGFGLGAIAYKIPTKPNLDALRSGKRNGSWMG